MAVAQAWGASESFILVAIPLFVLMAMILERSGIADDMYEMMYLWFGGVRGGLLLEQLSSVQSFLQCAA
jgi:TRAP-type mannitol/chloroaromatic compound transport system permease large subunit